MIDQIRKLLEPISRRVMLLCSRAIIGPVNDNNPLQSMQLSLLADETRDGVQRAQEYGFTSVPLPGAEAIALFPGGNRANGVVIAVEDRRYRLKGLQGGEVALYTDEGDSIHFKRGRTISCTTVNFEVNASKLAFNNGSYELISLLSEFVNLIETARTEGDAQAIIAPSETWDAFKAKVNSFIDTADGGVPS